MSALGDFEERFNDDEAEMLTNEGLGVDIIEDIIAYIKTLQE